MGEDYTKREMDTFFEGVHRKLDTITQQVTKTNGRVKNLELWRAFLAGGLAVLTVIVVPLLFIIIQKFL